MKSWALPEVDAPNHRRKRRNRGRHRRQSIPAAFARYPCRQVGQALADPRYTSDITVRIAEVEHLVAAFQGAGKSFEHRIYQAAPGRHHFNRIDTKLAVESRAPMYKFLQRYLQP